VKAVPPIQPNSIFSEFGDVIRSWIDERLAGGVLTLHTRIDAETNIENWRRSLAGGRGRLSRSLLTSTWTVFFSYAARTVQKQQLFFAVLLIAEAKVTALSEICKTVPSR